MKFILIAALANNGGIGYNQNLPWPKRLSIDMTFFRFITSETRWNFSDFDHISTMEHNISTKREDKSTDTVTRSPKNVVIMGRKTFEAVKTLGIPPFKNRINMILSSERSKYPEIDYYSNLNDALDHVDLISQSHHIPYCFVIGGGQVYQHAILHHDCEYVIITEVFDHPDLPIDTWFPMKDLNSHFSLIRNITLQVLEILYDWSEVGKSTRELIGVNLEKCRHENYKDPYVIEHGLSFRFLLYKKKIQE